MNDESKLTVAILWRVLRYRAFLPRGERRRDVRLNVRLVSFSQTHADIQHNDAVVHLTSDEHWEPRPIANLWSRINPLYSYNLRAIREETS